MRIRKKVKVSGMKETCICRESISYAMNHGTLPALRVEAKEQPKVEFAKRGIEDKLDLREQAFS